MVLPFVHPFQQLVEDGNIAMIGEAKVADAAFLLLFHQPVQNTIVHKPGIEFLFGIPTAADSMQQQIVDIIYLQLLQ